MPGESKNGMQCAEFDVLLSDAVDEKLTGVQVERFQAHARICPVCGPLWTEAQAGQRWLKSLVEVNPPTNLVHNILVATSGHESAQASEQAKTKVSWKDAVTGWLQPVFGPAFTVARQPRFVMSFGMAFFSLSVALSMAGVKVSDLRQVDLRPTAIKRNYYETSGRVVKYYENIRFVYEIESRVREFKRVTTPAAPAPEPQNQERKNNNNNDTSGQPDQNQERNYSQGETQPVLASAPNDPPVVSETTYRRLV